MSVRLADYDDRDGLVEAFRGVETLILIPTKSPIVPRIQEHANALDAARAAGVKRVLFLSISTAQPDSLSAVAPFILYAESATRLSGMDWVILRMGLYAEPLADWAPELAATGRLPYPVRSGRVAYVTREDIAWATAAAGADPTLKNEIFELTGPEAISMPDLAGAVSEATGKPVRFETVSDAEFLEICALDKDTPPFVAQVLVSLYHAVDAGEFEQVTNHIERLTGRRPEGIESFLKRTLTASRQ